MPDLRVKDRSHINVWEGCLIDTLADEVFLTRAKSNPVVVVGGRKTPAVEAVKTSYHQPMALAPTPGCALPVASTKARLPETGRRPLRKLRGPRP